jgi:hypothetical protein
MRREAKRVRAPVRTLLKGLAVSIAISLALSMAMLDAASTTPVAPARAEGRIAALSERISDRSRTPAIEERADSTLIREAHSDGGYWYWLEQQPADRGIGH